MIDARPTVRSRSRPPWRIPAAALAASALLLAAGCATQIDLPPLPESHPANAAAPAAPYARPSGLLDAAAPAPAAEPAPMEGHDHGAPEMDESDPPEPEAEAHDHHDAAGDGR